VNVIVISYKDRLTRFGFKYLEEFLVRMKLGLKLYSEKNLKTYSKSLLRI